MFTNKDKEEQKVFTAVANETGRLFSETSLQEHLQRPACHFETCDSLTITSSGERQRGHTTDETGLCFTCRYWLDMYKRDSNHTAGRLVIEESPTKRVHYVYDPKEPIKGGNRNLLGMSGHLFQVRYLNGMEVETNDLWCQSSIPERFWDLFPVNAEFIQHG